MRKAAIILLTSLFLVILVFSTNKNNIKNENVLTFSTWGSETELPIINSAIKQFEKENPSIKVKLIHIPKNYFQKVHLLIASDLSPDVIFINNIDGQKYIRAGVLLNLNNFINSDKTFSSNSFYEKALNAFKYKNAIFAIPRDISNLVIYYNKDLFDKYGVKYPSANWTLNDFLETSKKLTINKNKDKNPEQFGIGFETAPLFWLPFLWSNGGGIISSDGENLILGSQNSIDSIQFYSNLRNSFHVAPTASEAGSMTMGQMFINQKIAMQINGRWAVPRYRKDLKFNWDIAQFPLGKKGSIVDADASGWSISKQCKHPETAWKFIKFMSNKKSIDKITETGLIIPARKDSANSDLFIDTKNKPHNAHVFLDIIKSSFPTPASRNYNEISSIVSEALEPVWNGEKTAKETINKHFLKKLENTFNEGKE